MKTCTRCKETKPVKAFNKLHDAHHWWCKACHKAYRQEPAVRAKRLAYLKQWREENPDYWKSP